MKAFIVLFTVVFIFLGVNVYAFEGSTVSIGSDIDEENKSSTLKIVEATENTPEVIVTNEEEKNYLSGIIPDSRINTKAVICASITMLSDGHGITASTHNTEYITPEMLTNSLITAGIKDMDVKIAAPYSVSGNTCIIYVIKAYEKMTGDTVSENARIASTQELAVMSDLGQKIGMQKALQLVNSMKVEVVKNPIQSKRSLNEIISLTENKFNVTLDESAKSYLILLMDKISQLGLNEDDVSKQQKNISLYVNDVSKTEIDDNIFNKFLNWLLTAFKSISQILGISR